jgi:NADPH2:quinone reductase
MAHGHELLFPATGAAVHAALRDLLARQKIRPDVARRIRMGDVGAVLEEHLARRTTGRTVVDIAGS